MSRLPEAATRETLFMVITLLGVEFEQTVQAMGHLSKETAREIVRDALARSIDASVVAGAAVALVDATADDREEATRSANAFLFGIVEGRAKR